MMIPDIEIQLQGIRDGLSRIGKTASKGGERLPGMAVAETLVELAAVNARIRKAADQLARAAAALAE